MSNYHLSPSYFDTIDYIPYAINYILWLIYNWRFVPLNCLHDFAFHTLLPYNLFISMNLLLFLDFMCKWYCVVYTGLCLTGSHFPWHHHTAGILDCLILVLLLLHEHGQGGTQNRFYDDGLEFSLVSNDKKPTSHQHTAVMILDTECLKAGRTSEPSISHLVPSVESLNIAPSIWAHSTLNRIPWDEQKSSPCHFSSLIS